MTTALIGHAQKSTGSRLKRTEERNLERVSSPDGQRMEGYCENDAQCPTKHV